MPLQLTAKERTTLATILVLLLLGLLGMAVLRDAPVEQREASPKARPAEARPRG